MSKEFSHLDGVDLNYLSDEDIEKLSEEDYNFLLAKREAEKLPEEEYNFLFDQAVAKRNAWMDEQIDQGNDLGTFEDFIAPEEPQYAEDDLKTSEQLIAEDKAARERLEEELDVFGPMGYRRRTSKSQWGGIDLDSIYNPDGSDLKKIRQAQNLGTDLQNIKPFLSPDSKYLNYIDAVSPPKSTDDDTPDWAKNFLKDTSNYSDSQLFNLRLDKAAREIEAFPWQDQEFLRYLSPEVLKLFKPKNILTTSEEEFDKNQAYRKNLYRQKKRADKYEKDFSFTPYEKLELVATDFVSGMAAGIDQGAEEVFTQLNSSKEFFNDAIDKLTLDNLPDRKQASSELRAMNQAKNTGSLSQYLKDKGWTKPFRKQLSEFWDKGQGGDALNYLFAKAASTATSSFVPQIAAGTGTALAVGGLGSLVTLPAAAPAAAGVAVASLVGAIQSGSGKYLETLIETNGDRDKALENGLKASAITGGTSALGMGALATLGRKIGGDKATNFIERMFLSRSIFTGKPVDRITGGFSPKNARLLAGATTGVGLAIATEVGSEVADEALQQTYIDKKFNPETGTFLDPDALVEAAVLSTLIGGLGKAFGAFNFLTSDISETEIRKAIEAQGNDGEFNEFDTAFIQQRKKELNGFQRWLATLAGDQVLLDPLFKLKIEEDVAAVEQINKESKEKITKQEVEQEVGPMTPEVVSPLKPSDEKAPEWVLDLFGANPNIDLSNIDSDNPENVSAILAIREEIANVIWRAGLVKKTSQRQFENSVRLMVASGSELRRQGKIKDLSEILDVVNYQVLSKLAAFTGTNIADAAAVVSQSLDQLRTNRKDFGGDVRVQRDSEGRPVFKDWRDEYDYLRKLQKSSGVESIEDVAKLERGDMDFEEWSLYRQQFLKDPDYKNLKDQQSLVVAASNESNYPSVMTMREFKPFKEKYIQAEKEFDQEIRNKLSDLTIVPDEYLLDSDYDFIRDEIYEHPAITGGSERHTLHQDEYGSLSIPENYLGKENSYTTKLIEELASKYGIDEYTFGKYLEDRADRLTDGENRAAAFLYKYGSTNNLVTLINRFFNTGRSRIGLLKGNYPRSLSHYDRMNPNNRTIDGILDTVFFNYRIDPENAFDLNREVTFTKEDGTEVIVHRGKIYRSNPDEPWMDRVTEQFSREQFLEAAGVGRVLYQKDKPSDKFQKMLDEAQSPKTTSEVVTPSMAKKPDKYTGTDEALKDRDQKSPELQTAKAATKAYGANRKMDAGDSSQKSTIKIMRDSDKSVVESQISDQSSVEYSMDILEEEIDSIPTGVAKFIDGGLDLSGYDPVEPSTDPLSPFSPENLIMGQVQEDLSKSTGRKRIDLEDFKKHYRKIQSEFHKIIFEKGKFSNISPESEAAITGKTEEEVTKKRKSVTDSFVEAVDFIFSSGINDALDTLIDSIEDSGLKESFKSSYTSLTNILKDARKKSEEKARAYEKKWIDTFYSQREGYIKVVQKMYSDMIKFYSDSDLNGGRKTFKLKNLNTEEIGLLVDEVLSENTEFSRYPEEPSFGDRGMKFNKKSRRDGALLFLHRKLLEKSNAVQKVNKEYGETGNRITLNLFNLHKEGMKHLLNKMSKNSIAMDFAADGVNATPEQNAAFFKEYKDAALKLRDEIKAAKEGDISAADKAVLTEFEEDLKASFGNDSDLGERIRVEKQERELHNRLMETWGLKEDDLVFDGSRTDIVRGQLLSNFKTGRHVIQLFAGADMRTLVHEQAHLLRVILGENNSDLNYVRRLIGMGSEDSWDGKDSNGELFEEKFAEWMENFALNWRQQPKKSRKIWGKIIDWSARAIGQIKDPEELYASMNEERLMEAYGDNLKTEEHKEAIAREMVNRTLGKWLKDPLADVISNRAPKGKTQTNYDLWHSYMLDRSWAIGQVKEAAGDKASKSIWDDPTWAFRQILGSSGKVYNYLTKGFYNPYKDDIDRLNEVIKAGGRYDRRTGKVFDSKDNEVEGVRYRRNIHDMMNVFNELETLLKDGKVSKSEKKVLKGLINEYSLKDPKEFSSFLYRMYKMKYHKSPAMKKSYEDLFKRSKSSKKLVDEALSIFQENLEHAVDYMKSSGILPEIDNILKRDESLLGGVLKSLNKSSEFYKDVNGLSEAMVFITKSAVEIGDRNRAHLTLKNTIGKTAEPYMFGKELNTTEYRMLSDDEKKSVQLIHSINDKGEQVKEYWAYSPAIQQVFDSINQDGYDSGIMGLLEVIGDFGAPFANFQRTVITHGLPFLFRNPIRDIQSAATQSRTVRDSKGLFRPYAYLKKYLPSSMSSFKKELIGGKDVDFGVSGDIPMSTFMRELTGGGFVDQFSDSQVEAYYSALSSQMAKYSKTGTDFVIKPSAYQNSMDYLRSVRDKIPLVKALNSKNVAASESLARNMEYEAAYDYFIGQGLDPAEARAKATAEAVDLIDFAKVGLAMRHINKWVVFSNAAMQGLWRTVRSFTDDTTGKVTAKSIAKNWAKIGNAWILAVVLPRLALRLLSGEEEDRERMSEPAEVRDTFITVNLGKVFGNEGSSFKLRIPQPFEHSVMAAGADRFIDYFFYGDDSAFTGYGKSLFNSFSPFTASSIYGPFELIPQLLQNKKFYTDTDIIPSWELEQDDVTKRSGNKHFGPVISYFQDLTGWDARNIDFALKDTFAYFGSTASAIDRAMGDQGLPPEQGAVGFTFDKVLGMALYQTPLHDKNVRVILDEKGNEALSKEYNSIKGMINKWWGLSKEEDLQKAIELRKKIQKKANQIVNNKRDKFKKSLLF